MSYFKKFKKKFYDKLILSELEWPDEYLAEIERCFENAAKETMATKKKENEGYQTQRSPKVDDDTMTPFQIAAVEKAKSRNQSIAEWLIGELRQGKTVDDIEEEYKNFGGGR